MYNNSHKDLVSINQYRAHKYICKNRMLYKFATTNGNFEKKRLTLTCIIVKRICIKSG